MGWARIDDGWDDHPKVLELLDHEEEGWAAITLWVLCLTWAHRNTRRAGKVPGLIPTSLPRRYLGGTGRDAAALLVKVGLWEAADKGWLIHDFADYLPSEQTRQARAAAGKKGAEARWRGKDADGSARRGDGNEPSSSHADHGNEPSSSHGRDGNEPSAGYSVASSGLANDGSRTRARRAPTPNPGPEPEPSTPPSPPHAHAASSAGPAADHGGEGGEIPDGREGGREDAQVIDMGIVAEVQAMRPDWSPGAIRRTLEHPDVRGRPVDLVRAAFALVAADPQTRHPGRLAADGPWWREAFERNRPRLARPAWCGQCDAEASRMVELPDGRVARCPVCHPLEARPA